MAENVTEKGCLKCGAEFRPGSLFCYGCGTSVNIAFGSENQTNGNSKNDFLQEEFIQTAEKEDSSDEAGAIEKPIGMPLEIPLNAPLQKDILEGQNKKLAVEKETKLKTAASLRRRPKPEIRKTVEVIWQQPESSNHPWFVLVSLILVLFAVCMTMLMLYFR
ncbi:MAG: hypothetical protein ACR2L1_08710 [Pyrinomonadaceae bacterium]